MAKHPFDILQEQYGKHPATTEADTVICHYCLAIYEPGRTVLAWCRQCYNQGHCYRCKSLEECKWWLKVHEARAAAGEWIAEPWAKTYRKVVKAFEAYYQEQEQ